MPRPHLTTTARGYGWEHQQARAQALRRLRDGDPCARCHKPMYRSQASTLDLDHTEDRATYRGLAHARCNRQAGQRVGVMRRMAKRVRAKQTRAVNSRAW